ncbi:MAG: hypothetical protein J6K57_08025 [Alistipes sp.]|nr:hypothetical protein [Alistipes sp.]
MTAYENKVEASSDGATIEVTKVENRNFIFTVRPGEAVQSYRLDVYPLAHLYNSLYERMRSEGKSKLEARDVDTYIRDLIFNASGSGGFTFDPTTHSDYAAKEFDWMNSTYSQVRVVPDSEYIIIVIACYDKEGTNDGEMSLCYVKTPSATLVGDPRVNVNVKVSYTAMDITYEPNSDCKYLYQWCSNESDLKDYINIYGEKLYIDFMRHTVIGDPISATDTDSCHFYIDFGQDASSDVPIMATAIALDENFTPAKSMDSKVFTLLPKPTVPAASCSMSVVADKIGASYVWYEMNMEPTTPFMFYKFMSPSNAEYYKTKATAAELAALARDLNDDGYGLKNENYSYNETTDTFGGSYTAYEILYATPDTEYVIAYVGRNRVQELGEVKFTEPFKTKALVTDSPATCQSDCKLTLTPHGRTGVTVTFNYDFTKHAGVRFQYIEPVLDGAQPSADAGRDTFLSFLGFGMPGDAEGLISNNWAAEPTCSDTFTLPGFEPGTKIKYAYMCEDWNGVVGELLFEEVTLPDVEDGDNPTSAITANYDAASGTVVFEFTANNQTAEMKYLVGDINMDNDALGIKYLGNENYYTAEEMIKKWTTYCSAQGLTTNNISTTLSEPAGRTMIALCIPYSKNAVRGPLSYVIWDGFTVKTLTDYYPNYTPAAAATNAAEHPALQSIKRPVTRVVSLK